MNKQQFDLDAYLQRVGYDGTTEPTVDSLKSLHYAQLYTIPFENFDIQLGRNINLNTEIIFEKLVHKKRGGYCFELNDIFLTALKSMGFDVRALLGRVHITGTLSGRGHQIELITINGKKWIADVGFGADTPRSPIPLEIYQPTTHDGQTVRLFKDGFFGIMLQILKDDRWVEKQFRY